MLEFIKPIQKLMESAPAPICPLKMLLFNLNHRHPLLLPLNDPDPDPPSPAAAAVVGVDFTIAAAGGGPILPHPGFVTLAAEPPNVILLVPPIPTFFTGESLALRTPDNGTPFSLPWRLSCEKTRFARPGEVVGPR